MKVAEYKGYEINFFEHGGKFSVNGISGWFDKYAEATGKIDRVIKAEVKDNYPIDAIMRSMKVGRITSYNKLEKEVWFSPEGGSRGKERVTNYSGNSNFYKATKANLNLIMKYKTLGTQIAIMNKEQRELEKQLTDPITFEVED